MLLQATYFSTINPQFFGLPTQFYVPPQPLSHPPPPQLPSPTSIHTSSVSRIKFRRLREWNLILSPEILQKHKRGPLSKIFHFSN